MNPARWTAALERSDSLRPIPPHRDLEARGAVRLQVFMEAETFNGPVGVVSDPRYLVPEVVSMPHLNPRAGKPRKPYTFRTVKKAPYAGKENDDGDEG